MPSSPIDATHRRGFVPEYAVPPGETVQEVLESLGLSQTELAERTGRPKKTINEIIRGHAAITPETALQFERVLGVPAKFWISLEVEYRAALARQAERVQLEQQVGWLREIPVKAMVKAGWIEAKTTAIEQLKVVLSFFGVASVDAWREVWREQRNAVAFRESPSFASDFGTVAAWLRRSELEGRARKTAPFDAPAFRAVLTTVRELTNHDAIHFYQELLDRCASVGVAVVFVRELPGLRVCGATRWLAPDKALIALTLRYKRNDSLWFTFFHEAAHILLHGKRAVFVERPPVRSGEEPAEATAPPGQHTPSAEEVVQQEAEADQFAQDFLIPPGEYAQFRQQFTLTAHTICAFAQRIGIAPGIVVGRLEHDRLLPYSTPLNALKRSIDWAN